MFTSAILYIQQPEFAIDPLRLEYQNPATIRVSAHMSAQTDTLLLNPFGIELSIIQAPIACVTSHPIDWDPIRETHNGNKAATATVHE